MTVTTARPSRRVLHVLKHYQADRKAAGFPAEILDTEVSARRTSLSRPGLLERIRLRLEGMTVEEAARLVRRLLSAGHEVSALTSHSRSLVPGNTPCVRNVNQLPQSFGWLDRLRAFLREEVGGRLADRQEIRHPAAASPPASRA